MKNAGSKRVWSVATAVLTFAAEPRLLTGEGTLVVAGIERTVSERLAAALADRYRIERELGVGGMATVYLAEHRKHQSA